MCVLCISLHTSFMSLLRSALKTNHLYQSLTMLQLSYSFQLLYGSHTLWEDSFSWSSKSIRSITYSIEPSLCCKYTTHLVCFQRLNACSCDKKCKDWFFTSNHVDIQFAKNALWFVLHGVCLLTDMIKHVAASIHCVRLKRVTSL